MDLETFITAVFCLSDDFLHDVHLRQRGPQPVLADTEVLTIETVGEFLEIATEPGSTATSAGTTAGSCRPCRRCTAPRSPARRRLSG